MSQRPLFEETAADLQTPEPAASALTWELRASSQLLLSGAMSGRLRAGIVLGVRMCRDPGLRESVTHRLLLRLGSRL